MRNLIIIILVFGIKTVYSWYPSSIEKLGSIDTAYIDSSYISAGIPDTRINYPPYFSFKISIPFLLFKTYSLGIKFGYSLSDIIRVSAGLNYFKFNNDELVKEVLNQYLEENYGSDSPEFKDIELNLNFIKYFVSGMYNFKNSNLNIHASITFLKSSEDNAITGISAGIEKLFLKNRISTFLAFDFYLNLDTDKKEDVTLYNNANSKIGFSGGVRVFILRGFNITLSFIYPGFEFYLGENKETSEKKYLSLIVLPYINLSYRF